MNSVEASHAPDASGATPKQLDHIPNLKLSDGNEIPFLGYGLGTANFKRGDKSQFDEEVVAATVTALKAGYTHLDGAEAYGNEKELGTAITRSGVPRSSLFITTKTSCRASETIQQAFDRSLENLGLEYVDLYLIHSPFFGNPLSAPEVLQAAWADMEKIKESGRAKSIGVSNFLIPHLEAILATAKYPPVINQIEYHPYLQHVTPEGNLVEFHRQHNIALSAYSPLTAITKAKGGPVDAVYKKLANKYGVGESEVGLRWVLDQGIVALTTSKSEERLRGWLSKLAKFKLTPKEVEEISEAGKGTHHRGYWNNRFEENDRR
ncbi:NADP-dependent oxidoreductase domain-containing protein [Triangularia setosa]|uniref:NADP-dependent oxidoreductase domain-containing protein n=1 Tax=Triangularia setosa TaxID=2587417 RepID=A0AAN6W5T5_9PEZI|nr:NADP-dependent oxidoreductase domain-containing protein [Podospora setosa]